MSHKSQLHHANERIRHLENVLRVAEQNYNED